MDCCFEHVKESREEEVPSHQGGLHTEGERPVQGGLPEVYERCGALDVHKESVAACVRVPGPNGRHQEIRNFGTMTTDLLALRDWLVANGVTHVAMESTGVYWKPAAICPGNNESAGKKSGKTRQGNQWLRAALVQAARAAVRQKDSYFAAQYRRIVVRRGDKKAIVAVAHSLLVVIYHLLRNGTTYADLGTALRQRAGAAGIQGDLGAG